MAVFLGNSSNNDFVGTNDADTMYGGGGADSMRGGGGVDAMNGGTGDDVFIYVDGEDALVGELLSGGDDFDRVLVRASATNYTVDLRDAEFESIEKIEFRADSNDIDKWILLGSGEMDGPGELAANLEIDGNAAGGSSDNLYVYVTEGVRSVNLSNWTFVDWNTIAGTTDTVEVIGDSGNDTLIASRVADTISGLDGNDILNGGEGNDALYGGHRDDTLSGDEGTDTLHGGDGNDLLIVGFGGGSDGIYGGLGTDTFDASSSGFSGATFDFETRIYGPGVALEEIEIFHDNGNGNTVISNGEGGTYNLHDGDDTFIAESGAETAQGGNGIDTLDLRRGNFVYTFNMATGLATAYPLELFQGFERVFTGMLGDNITGTGSADYMNSGAGNDWLTPGAGANTIVGGDDVDMISYVDSGTGVSANLALGTATHHGGSIDSLTGIENITGSATGADNITGSAGANRIRGLGNYDWLVGSGGGDTFEGGEGRDMVSYVNAGAGVTVNLGAGQGQAGQALGDSYVGIERATGSVFADMFIGSNGADDFRGLGGDDWFVGSGGGKDRYDGGTADDTVAYTNSASGVTASLLLGRGTGGDAAQDLYTSIENLSGSNSGDHLTGNNSANVLRGMAGNDTLLGNGGIDRLTGGGGNDSIDGGSGFDYAIFTANRADYSISTVGGVTTVDFLGAGGDGVDTVRNVESLRFADMDVLL